MGVSGAAATRNVMGNTVIEKIIREHAGGRVSPGDVVDFKVDIRAAGDSDGARVAEAIIDNRLPIEAPGRTFFTFDCGHMGPDPNRAAARQFCRAFARRKGVRVYDVNHGIGPLVVIEEGLVAPGRTFVSTDPHANLVGGVGAFGMEMADEDMAHAFAFGSVWGRVPHTVKVTVRGVRGEGVTAKDLALALLRRLGTRGLEGIVGEMYGNIVDGLSLSERITIAAMGNQMGAVALLFPPSPEVSGYCRGRSRWPFAAVPADPDAGYVDEVVIDVSDVTPLISRPGRPDDVVPVHHIAGRPVDSVFIGSCSNGTLDDLMDAAELLRGRRVADGVVLSIIPATDAVWKECLERGLMSVFKDAGAMVGSAGCAGCGVGESGRGEVTVSTGCSNVTSNGRRGDVYLASPATAAASAVAGAIATAASVLREPYESHAPRADAETARYMELMAAPSNNAEAKPSKGRPVTVKGRVSVVDEDDIDADMIYHNGDPAVTKMAPAGRRIFNNLMGWKDFPARVKAGDIVVTGRNFGCGAPKPQAVECFKSLGISLIIARSFGATFQRNAINAGLPVMTAELVGTGLRDGDRISADLITGAIEVPSRGLRVKGSPFSGVQMDIYQRGGLLKARSS